MTQIDMFTPEKYNLIPWKSSPACRTSVVAWVSGSLFCESLTSACPWHLQP